MHALVTGASGAIGEAIARHLHRDGYAVSLVARSEDKLAALAEELPGSEVVVADLCAPGAAADVVSRAVAALGPVDVLVNNAGMQYVEPFHTVGPERIARMITLNMTAPLQLMHAVLGAMRERGQGTVINVTSMAGVNPAPGMGHYAGSKAGLAAASEAAAVELRDQGIQVITVYPGPVYSDMHAASADALGDGFLVRWVPTGTGEGLAARLGKAMQRGQRRIVYPRAYAPAFAMPRLAQPFVDRWSPRPSA